MTNVLVHVGTRADLFPLAPVLFELQHHNDIRLTVLTTVGFDEADAAMSLLDVGLDLQGSVEHVHLGTAEFVKGEIAQNGSELVTRIEYYLGENEIDVCLILGDRWELLYVVPPLVLRGKRIVHLHGGEITLGAIDDRVRHAISKLSDFHCVATEAARLRLLALGEEPNRISLTGAPGLDRLERAQSLTDDEFLEKFGGELQRPLGLVTIHPETATGSDPFDLAMETLRGLKDLGSVVITSPGHDRGRESVLRAIGVEAAERPNWFRVDSLGSSYERMLATSDVMVGNSSSGIIEAATFGLPVVNVGRRQEGRDRGTNVIDCHPRADEVREAVREATSREFRATANRSGNIYGDGLAAKRIVSAVEQVLSLSRIKPPFGS